MTRVAGTAAATGALETVAEFWGPMPAGVAVSRRGRIFVSFPRWSEPVSHTVAELVGGETRPFPDLGVNLAQDDPSASLLSVQSLVIDAADRLWLLDTGSIAQRPLPPGGPKLAAIDLQEDKIAQTFILPSDVALPSTYLNDLCINLRCGAAGTAFISDSAPGGPNGIIVVDLQSGQSWRRLHDHPSTRSEQGFLPIVEGEPLMDRPPDGRPTPFRAGVDGIALDATGERLFYSPTASRRLYSVSVAALADESLPDEWARDSVVDHGEKGVSDGLAIDSANRLYTTNWEHNAILRRRADGTYETLVQDARLLWPDSLTISSDGWLYVTANQFHRRPGYHAGLDRRTQPYRLLRIFIDAEPPRLG